MPSYYYKSSRSSKYFKNSQKKKKKKMKYKKIKNKILNYTDNINNGKISSTNFLRFKSKKNFGTERDQISNNIVPIKPQIKNYGFSEVLISTSPKSKKKKNKKNKKKSNFVDSSYLLTKRYELQGIFSQIIHVTKEYKISFEEILNNNVKVQNILNINNLKFKNGITLNFINVFGKIMFYLPFLIEEEQKEKIEQFPFISSSFVSLLKNTNTSSSPDEIISKKNTLSPLECTSFNNEIIKSEFLQIYPSHDNPFLYYLSKNQNSSSIEMAEILNYKMYENSLIDICIIPSLFQMFLKEQEKNQITVFFDLYINLQYQFINN